MNLPDRRVLEKLFRGQLPSEVAEKLRRKLDDPEYFARVAEAVMADETFVGALGETKIAEAGAPPAMPAPAPGYEPTKIPSNAPAPLPSKVMPASVKPMEKPPVVSRPGPIPKK